MGKCQLRLERVKWVAAVLLHVMSDLVCTTCGASTTYADAYIADRERTCDGRTEHDWVEPLHNKIDIVIG
jgi:hypothetical protein